MPRPLPEALSRLLEADLPEARDQAWEAFVAEYSRLIHSTARKSSTDYDTLMERYTFVLQHLREDDCKRLRGFDPSGRSKFTTWLVVVSSRLCVDYHRSKYGRGSADGDGSREADTRRRLVDLIGEDVGLDRIPDRPGRSPDVRPSCGSPNGYMLHQGSAGSTPKSVL